MRIKIENCILDETSDFVWLNKPPGISSLEDRQNPGVSILELLRKHIGPNVSLCHRLDKETSGVLLASLNPDAYRFAAMLFEHRKVAKIYHAICDGQQDMNEQIDLPLRVTRNGMVVIDRGDGKPSVTQVKTLEIFQHHSLIEAMPETGRMHQIRVHLAARRASITGDILYGGKPAFLSSIKRKFKMSGEIEKPLMNRVALHAQSLRFHISDQEKVVTAPYPTDLAVFRKQLEKYDR